MISEKALLEQARRLADGIMKNTATPGTAHYMAQWDWYQGVALYGLYDWRWEEPQKNCMNRALTQSREFDFEALTCTRDLEKPFFVSEWDVPWPNEYRAESAIVFAAASALQGYSGLAIHTYAYSSRLSEMRVLGKEVSSSAIGGVPFREGVFSTWNDPAKYMYLNTPTCGRRIKTRYSSRW